MSDLDAHGEESSAGELHSPYCPIISKRVLVYGLQNNVPYVLSCIFHAPDGPCTLLDGGSHTLLSQARRRRDN
jgi:hypothetical protein